MRRSPIRRGGKTLRRKTGLRRVSDKRRLREAERAVAVEEAFRRHDHRCVAASSVPEVACSGHLDAHEPLPRARGGSIYDPANIVPLCRAHHDWTHTHPADATQRGLLVATATVRPSGTDLE